MFILKRSWCREQNLPHLYIW